MRVHDRPLPTIGGPRPSGGSPATAWPVDLYIGLEREPVVNYVYDDYTAAYDSPSGAFVYDDAQEWPYDRYDLVCKCHGLTITTGGPDSDGVMPAGHVEISLDNHDGQLSQFDAAGRLVDWIPGAALDIWASFGRGTSPIPAVPGYLTPTVGTVTTPDPGPLPTDCVLVFKADMDGAVPTQQRLAGIWEAVESWLLFFPPSSGPIVYLRGGDGALAGGTLANADQITPFSYGAVRIQRQAGGQSRYTWLQSSDGVTWTDFVFTLTGAPVSDHPSTSAPLAIGGLSTGGEPFQGRIYSVELRSGLDPAAGTVLWRFDAGDYPGTGTSYTDPRGRTWTLTNANAITPTVPAVPAGPPDAFWLFSGTITAWRERSDGTVDAEAFDAFSRLSEEVAEWDPGNYGDTVTQRLDKILAAYSYTGPTRFDTGTVSSLHSYFTTTTPLAEMQSVALSDGGVLVVDADGTLVYRNRQWTAGRDDQDTVPVYSDNYCAAPYIVWDAEMTTDDEAILNRVTLKSVADVAVTSSDQTSLDRYGPQTLERTGDQWVGAVDGQALADHLVLARRDPYVRLEQYVLHLTDPMHNLWRTGIDRRLGDTVTWEHAQPTTTGVNLLILNLVVDSIVHEITPHSWVTTVGTTRTISNILALRYDRTPFDYDDPDPRNIYAA